MYRRQPVELHDPVRGNANVERDRHGEHPAALPPTVHGGVLPYNGCNFQAEEGGDAALMQALVISISSIVYRLVMTCFEMQREHLDPSGVCDAAGPYGGWFATGEDSE